MKQLNISWKIILISSFFILGKAMAQCSFCQKVEWINGPSLDQFNSFKLVVDPKLEIDFIKVTPFMEMPGDICHSSRPSMVKKISAHEFLIEKIYFTGGMEGKWFLIFEAFNKNNQLIKKESEFVL